MTVTLWVTGLGLVTPLGVGVDATWNALVRGDRAIGPVTLFDVADQRVGLGAEVRAVPAENCSGGRASVSRTSTMALLAAEEAIRFAQVDVRASRVGLVVGTTTGGMFETEGLLAKMHAERRARAPAPAMECHPLTATVEVLERALGPFDRVRTLASACSSGANALIVAASWLRSGEVDVVLAGGADSLCRLTLSGFNALGAIDAEPCRPFSRARRGTTLGEGAGFLVIEASSHARARGARPFATLAGWATGAEAHHITNPAADGAVAAALMVRALARAGIAPGDVDYVNAHGTGTLHNDAMEAAALARALGPEVDRIPVSSSKGQIGHTLGAAGAIGAAITALVVARRILVPTAGLAEPDPALRLVHVPWVGRAVSRVRAALSNAFGFGGMDAVLVFSEAGEPDDERRSDSLGAFGAGVSIVPRVVVTGTAVLGPQGADVEAHLDPDRARRLDRAAGLGALVAVRALAEAGADADAAGIVLGTAFGNVDASAAFLHRVFAKGPRFAGPAEFPNLVPSSPAGHVSIYLGAHGPLLTTADLGTTGESAFFQAIDFLRAGEADTVVAGAVDLRSDLVDRALAPLFQGLASTRSDLAAALVVEAETRAQERGARILARVERSFEWRGGGDEIAAALPAPVSDRAEVVVARADAATFAFIAESAWSRCPVIPCPPALGEGEAIGAVALAVAASRLSSGDAQQALVIGLSPAGGYAVVLEAR